MFYRCNSGRLSLQGRDEPYTLNTFAVTSWENSRDWDQGPRASELDPVEVNKLVLFRNSPKGAVTHH